MFDSPLRPLKDHLFTPLTPHIPTPITPLHITALAFTTGLASLLCILHSHTTLSLLFWLLNRALDCLDGALARHRGVASDLGGFLDLLGDFVVYGLIPIAVAQGLEDVGVWKAVAWLEVSYFINNFILFFLAACSEKAKAAEAMAEGPKKEGAKKAGEKSKELTSLMMRPALVEGVESGVLFTIMIAFPGWVKEVSLLMAGLVGVGIVQRTVWAVRALS